MPPFEDWSGERLRRMLKDRVPENLHLDYKAKGSLLGKKKGDDISKDVTALLNSDGGVLIYGVPEQKDETGVPIPSDSKQQEIGFKKGEINKEQIEDLITSNISPRPGPDHFQITEINLDPNSVFVVEVQVGTGGVWQAKDKRYYRRFNYKSEPMDHYELEMVRNRSNGPDLSLVFGFTDQWAQAIESWDSRDPLLPIRLGVQNHSEVAVESMLIDLCITRSDPEFSQIPDFVNAGQAVYRHDLPNTYQPQTGRPYFQLYWNQSSPMIVPRYTPIFKMSNPLFITQFHIKDRSHLTFACRIQAPNMAAKGYIVNAGLNNYMDMVMTVQETKLQIL